MNIAVSLVSFGNGLRIVGHYIEAPLHQSNYVSTLQFMGSRSHVSDSGRHGYEPKRNIASMESPSIPIPCLYFPIHLTFLWTSRHGHARTRTAKLL